MATTAIIVGGVIAALAAGASAYMASENAAAQARAQQKAMNMQAEAEAAAGDARRRQVMYDAKRKMATLASREASSGVQIGEGSLLEDEMRFSSDAEYAAQVAQYPHVLASSSSAYSGRLFGAQVGRIKDSEGLNVGLAVGGSLATSYGSYGRSRPSAVGPDYSAGTTLGSPGSK